MAMGTKIYVGVCVIAFVIFCIHFYFQIKKMRKLSANELKAETEKNLDRASSGTVLKDFLELILDFKKNR